ncbi:MAG: hypothetical protein EOM85_02385 [Candidatus Moranbacteria bacterium]|nr:hypothetical protein [Candidatus Moranbacteria bacterium]
MANLYNKGSVLFNLQKFRDRKEEDELNRQRAEEEIKNKRTPLDRVFDTLSIGQYATMGALKGVVDKDTTVIGGILGGLRAGLPIGSGYEEGEHSFSDVLETAGWEPTSTTGKVIKGTVGLAGDIFLDPLTYVSGGVSALAKGSGKLGKTAKKLDTIADIAKRADISGEFKTVKEVGEKVFEKNFDDLVKLGEMPDVANRIAKERADDFIKQNSKLLEDIDNGMSLDRAKEIVKSSNPDILDEDLVKQASTLAKQYNKLHGIREASDVTLSLANAPFGEKIFKGLADKKVTLATAEQVGKIGDITKVAPTVAHVRDYIYKSKIGNLFNSKSTLYKLSKSKPDEVYKLVRYADVVTGMDKNYQNAKRDIIKFAEDLGLTDLTPDDHKQIIELLEDRSKRRQIKLFEKLIDTETGKQLLKKQEIKVRDSRIKYRSLREKKNALTELVNSVDSSVLAKTKEYQDLIKEYQDDILKLTEEDIANIPDFKIDDIVDLSFDMKYSDDTADVVDTVVDATGDVPEQSYDLSKILDDADAEVTDDEFNSVWSAVEKARNKSKPEEIVIPETPEGWMNELLKNREGLVGENQLPRSSFKHASKYAEMNELYKKQGYIEYANRKDAVRVADKSGFDVVQADNGKWRVVGKPQEIPINEFKMTKHGKYIDKKDLVDRINSRFLGMTGFIHQLTYPKQLDNILDMIKEGKTKADVIKYIEENADQFNGKAPLIDPYVKEIVGGYGGFKFFSDYKFTIDKINKIKSLQRDKAQIYVKKNIETLFRKHFGMEDKLIGKKGSEIVKKFANQGYVDFKDIREAQELIDFIGNTQNGAFKVTPIKLKSGETVLRVIAPEVSKTHSFSDLMTDNFLKQMNSSRKVKKMSDIYEELNINNVKLNELSDKEIEKMFSEYDLDYLSNEYAVRASKRTIERDRLFKSSYTEVLDSVAKYKDKKVGIDHTQIATDLADDIEFRESLSMDNVISKRTEDPYALPDERVFTRQLQKDQAESAKDFVKISEDITKKRIALLKIKKDKKLSSQFEAIVRMEKNKRNLAIGKYQNELKAKLKVDMFADEEEYNKVLEAVDGLLDFTNKNNPIKKIVFFNNKMSVKLTPEENRLRKILSGLELQSEKNVYFTSSKKINEMAVNNLSVKLDMKDIDDEFEYIKQALSESGRELPTTGYNYEELAMMMSERQSGAYMNSKLNKIGKQLDEGRFDKKSPNTNPINADAIISVQETAEKLSTPEKIVEMTEEVISSNFDKFRHMTLDGKKAYLEKTKQKIESLETQIKQMSEEYTFNIEKLEESKVKNLKQIEDLDAEMDEVVKEAEKMNEVLNSNEAKATYISSMMGTDELVKLVEEEGLLKFVLDDDLELDERIKGISDKLIDSFYEMGYSEREIRKLTSTIDAYMPHILTSEGAKFFDEIKDDEKILMKIPGFGDKKIGFGRAFNPHNMARSTEGKNIYELNEFFKNEFPDLVKGNNVFSTDLATIYMTRALKNAELIYDNKYMNNMFDLFGTPVKSLDDVKIDDEAYKRVMNFGKFKEVLTLRAEEMVEQTRRTARALGESFSNTDAKLLQETKMREMLDEMGYSYDTLFDLATPMVEIPNEQLEKVLGSGIADGIVFNVSSAIVDDANRLRKSQILKDNNKLIKMYDKFTHLIKLNQTTVMPGFHFRNKYGNTFNNWLLIGQDAVDLNNQKNALRVMKGISVTDTFTVKHLDGSVSEMSWDDAKKLAEDYGIIDEGFFERDFMASSQSASGMLKKIDPKLDPTNAKDFWFYNKGREIGTRIEGSDRLINFVHHLKKGMSPEDSREMVYKTLFDYGDLTQFERDVMKRIFPYYTWIRKNAPYQLEMMMEHPEKYRNVSKVINGITDMNNKNERVEDRYLADFAKDFAQLPFSATNQYGQKEPILWNPTLPYQDINKIPDGSNPLNSLREVASQMNPLLKVPTEFALNKNFFFDSELVEEGDNTGVEWGKHILNQLPATNAITGMFTKEGADLGLHTLNQVSGVKMSAYNYEAYKRQQIRKKLGIDSDDGK